jgi:hypothetical protein
MKLCPQCQFIYEDDQNLCDMDGKALVYDNRPGVFPDTLPAVTGRRRANAQLRFRVVPAVAAFVFPALLCLAYYASSPLWDSKFKSPSLKAETSETSSPPQIAPLQNNFSSPPAPKSVQSPTNPQTAPESGSVSAQELPETTVPQSERLPVVTKSADGLKTNDNSLGSSRHLPSLPGLTPLPRLASPRRLPAAKSEQKQPGSSTTPKKQALTNQKAARGSQTALIVEVKPSKTEETKRSKVVGFLKKTGRILKKPFQM